MVVLIKYGKSFILNSGPTQIKLLFCSTIVTLVIRTAMPEKRFRERYLFTNSTIMKGIENLLPQSTIDRAINHKIVFFDYEPEVTKLVRGKKVTEPEKWSINPDEKRNLCDWICQNGDAEDFKQFDTVFEILNDCGVD